MCQVTVPDDVMVSESPRVEFEGPDSDPVLVSTTKESNVYTASHSVEVTLNSRGEYTCSATYSVMGSDTMSPVGSDSLNADVMSETLSVSGVACCNPPSLSSSC